MNRKIIGSMVAIIVTLVVGVYVVTSSDGDIVVGKTYALAYSYKATIKGGTPARVFDFADRSLPRTSIVVPLRDARGVLLVVENPDLPPSTIRKVMVNVPTRVVEGVTYPGYTFPEWQYNLGTVGPQSVIPEVTPRK